MDNNNTSGIGAGLTNQPRRMMPGGPPGLGGGAPMMQANRPMQVNATTGAPVPINNNGGVNQPRRVGGAQATTD